MVGQKGYELTKICGVHPPRLDQAAGDYSKCKGLSNFGSLANPAETMRAQNEDYSEKLPAWAAH